MISLLNKKKKNQRLNAASGSQEPAPEFSFEGGTLDIEGLSAYIEKDVSNLEEHFDSIIGVVKEMYEIFPDSYLDIWADLKSMLSKRKLLYE